MVHVAQSNKTCGHHEGRNFRCHFFIRLCLTTARFVIRLGDAIDDGRIYNAVGGKVAVASINVSIVLTLQNFRISLRTRSITEWLGFWSLSCFICLLCCSVYADIIGAPALIRNTTLDLEEV